MNGSDRPRLIRHSIAIAVGTLFFLLFLLVCYLRELGPENPPKALLGFVIGLGACAVVAGLIEASGRPPEKRGFSVALMIEGVLLIVLTVIAWVWMGPVPLPPG